MQPPERPASTGVACRVCGVDDGEERAQRDLHLACAERATTKAKKREATRIANRVARAGAPLTHDELVTRLALERAGLIGEPTKRGRGRPPKAKLEQDENADDDEAGLTSDEVAAIDMVTRGGGLSTDGIG